MTEMLKLQTKYFGEVEYEQKDLIRFPIGMIGFEEEQEFLLLPFEGSGGGMLCLQSVKTPALAFVVLDPFALKPDYEPELEQAELKQFGVEEAGELGFYVLCAVKKPVSASTVNLKCPLVIHPETREARQVIMERYEMRHPLAEFSRGEGAAPC
jgi:flagellar assembly factor FliW